MTKRILQIIWSTSTEFIRIDPNSPIIPKTIITTVEDWPDGRVKYRAHCSEYSKKGRVIKMKLVYALSDNKHLKNSDVPWGTSDIELNLQTGKAEARWTHKNGSLAARVASGVLLDASLLEEVSYEEVLRLCRPEQSKIRTALFKIYDACAISGEKTKCTLDAAHIIDAARGGAYTVANCFLLRTDYHRLYDKKLFDFSSGGRLILKRGLQGPYRKELEGKALSAEVIQHVGDALRLKRRHVGNPRDDSLSAD